MSIWGRKTFCVVAGASRGIGQAIAHAFAKKVGEGSVLVLLARSSDALLQTKSLVAQDPSKTVQVVTTSIDLSTPDPVAFQSTITGALSEAGKTAEDFEQSILVQCAASLGIDKGLRVDQMEDVGYIRSYLDFNVASFVLLNSVFCRLAGQGRPTTIVQISSQGAVEPFKTWGLYCAARAAKDMLLRSIALESPHIHTLNYSPGVVDTENYAEALRDTKDQDVVKAFEEERKKGRFLTPGQTAETLVQILESGKYVKGEHVSYDQH